MLEQVQSEGKKREDLSFGQIAIREQFVSPDRVLECLEIQRKLQGLDVESKRIGEILIEKGYLTQDQAGRIAEIQTKQKPSTGTRPTRSQKKLSVSLSQKSDKSSNLIFVADGGAGHQKPM